MKRELLERYENALKWRLSSEPLDSQSYARTLLKEHLFSSSFLVTHFPVPPNTVPIFYLTKLTRNPPQVVH